jgi:hypothetical protein
MPGAFHGIRVALVLVLMLVPTLSCPGARPRARARPHSLLPCSPWCLPWCSSSLSLALLTLELVLVRENLLRERGAGSREQGFYLQFF